MGPVPTGGSAQVQTELTF